MAVQLEYLFLDLGIFWIASRILNYTEICDVFYQLGTQKSLECLLNLTEFWVNSGRIIPCMVIRFLVMTDDNTADSLDFQHLECLATDYYCVAKLPVD